MLVEPIVVLVMTFVGIVVVLERAATLWENKTARRSATAKPAPKGVNVFMICFSRLSD